MPTSSTPGRDGWAALAPPLQAAVEEAWSAYCAGSLPHGAVIADAQGRVLVRGRNRVYEQEAGSPSGPLYGCPLAHAEVNALLALDYASVDVRWCVLYATTEPWPLLHRRFGDGRRARSATPRETTTEAPHPGWPLP